MGGAAYMGTGRRTFIEGKGRKGDCRVISVRFFFALSLFWSGGIFGGARSSSEIHVEVYLDVYDGEERIRVCYSIPG